MSSAEVRTFVHRHHRLLAAGTAAASLIGWTIFVVSWLVGAWASVFIATIALYWGVSTLAFAARIRYFGQNFLQIGGRSRHYPHFGGALAAGLWIARFPSPWSALLVVWGLTLCAALLVLWHGEATNADTPGVLWPSILKEAAIGSLWNVGGTLLGLATGRVLSF
jgi:hypothetical protein